MTPPLAEWQDADLAHAALVNVEAFAELYRRHVGSVYRYLLARTGSASSAEDLTAQTFEAALASLAAFRQEGAFIGWLMAIARAAANDYFRQRYRSMQIEAPLEDFEDADDDAPAVDEVVAIQLELGSVLAALAQIAPERAEVVRLRLFADLDTAETARVMGKTEAAVKMLLHRALTDLRRQITLNAAPSPKAD